MANLAPALFLTFLVASCCWDSVKADQQPKQESEKPVHDEPEDVERVAAAFAHASVSVQPGGYQKFQPRPGPVIPNKGLIECYACLDCTDVITNTPKKWCPRPLGPNRPACVSYTEKYQYLQKPWVIRGCASERGTCADIKQAHSGHSDIVKLLSCHECEGDLCNSASRSVTDLTFALFSLLVTPLLVKATLS